MLPGYVRVGGQGGFCHDQVRHVESPHLEQPENRKTIEALTEVFGRQTAAHWRRVFEATGVKATVVSDFAEAERAGLIDVNSPVRVRCGPSEVATLPSIVAPALRRAPATFDCPEIVTPAGR